MLLLDTNILIDVLRGEAVALAWIEVLVGCRVHEAVIFRCPWGASSIPTRSERGGSAGGLHRPPHPTNTRSPW